jgi:RNA polymerase sigma-70 factor (ECF subfamily)
MAALAASESGAPGAIVRHWHPRLLRYFRRLGADAHAAEDHAQETLLRVYRYRHAYRARGRWSAFLFTVARRVFLDARRRRRPSPVGAVEDRTQEDPREGHDERLDLAQAVRALPDHLRGVVEIAGVRGLSYARTADLLGIPVGTVKSRMHAAMARLRERMGAGP